MPDHRAWAEGRSAPLRTAISVPAVRPREAIFHARDRSAKAASVSLRQRARFAPPADAGGAPTPLRPGARSLPAPWPTSATDRVGTPAREGRHQTFWFHRQVFRRRGITQNRRPGRLARRLIASADP